ncbi:peptidylprolyl isomerase [Methyloversatilis sp.]|uniref:peptidylprolyl isomerase n=1 Tax=Methyloversatilis sp. TaxID=2569862 RepID=UPI003F6E8F6D
MSFCLRRLITASALLPLFAGSTSLHASDTVATVNGRAVPRAQLDFIIKEQVRQGRPATPELSGKAREEVISREVLAQEAERKLGQSEALRTRLEFMRQQALINALREDFFLNTRPTEAELRSLYDGMATQVGERDYRVRHIVVEQESQAKALIDQLKRGARFEELAQAQSKDRDSGPSGGLLDWTPEGAFSPEFAAALPTLTRGKVAAQPVKSSAGWHVVKLEDVRPAQRPKFEDLQPRLAESLIEQKWRAYLNDVRARAVVK